MNDLFNRARHKEMEYHDKFYAETELFLPGSWLSRPVKVVLDILTQIQKDNIQVLDLGCGVGRNSIPIAQSIQAYKGKIYCIDLLPSAIQLLEQNAEKYEVTDTIISQVIDVENFLINKNTFDYIVACSCLEHVSSKAAFQDKLEEMKAGTTVGGINCILMSTEVKEIDLLTGEEREGLIELNLSTEKVFAYLREVYVDWNITIEKSVQQEIKEEIDGREIIFKSNWITFVAQARD
ncbi:class I SAM-dependent methyltransferase [Paenibacillus sp. CGMCC 1.16610]|uniref:Methyltransferase domain-containing protein n=1 Tax=Paenibacillus anseongense TaxID=2682845 RepID=A0ABW9UBI7_9BACL|nr:class I SAM-dependent methyltransferase [Paenibacillus sp. CGMCC 1.16610]MBA2937308.1 class I SAM-dependent methyltransferase [Paenibacillus sp. CGMCC 1.16610]MVQ36366.1 methyltransferase domain-containing protein [Paenibacillus anseongense]